MSSEALTSIAPGIAFMALVNQGEHSQRRAAAVVGSIVGNFTVDASLPRRWWTGWSTSQGMGERQLLDNDNPEAAVNRRVEIRNVTRAR